MEDKFPKKKVNVIRKTQNRIARLNRILKNGVVLNRCKLQRSHSRH